MWGWSLPDGPDCAALLREGPEALQDPLWPTFLATEKHRWITGTDHVMEEAEGAEGGVPGSGLCPHLSTKVLFLTKAS